MQAGAPTTEPPAAGPGRLQVHYIDVSQGDSILIQTPDGKAALIDGGEAGSGALAYLRNKGIQRLDLMVATHPHSDHIVTVPDCVAAEVVSNGMAGRP